MKANKDMTSVSDSMVIFVVGRLDDNVGNPQSSLVGSSVGENDGRTPIKSMAPQTCAKKIDAV